MKKEWLIVWAVVLAFGLFSCKKVDVPQKVQKAFEQKFANVEKLQWEQEKNNLWEAEFKLNGEELSATFDSNGTWMETESEIEAGAVPQAVLQAVEKKFPGYTAKEWEKVEMPDKTVYEVKLKGKNGEKLKVQFDKTGTGLKREKL